MSAKDTGKLIQKAGCVSGYINSCLCDSTSSLPAAACALPTVNNSVNLVGNFVNQRGLRVHVFTVECGMGYYVAPSATSGRCSGPGGEFSMVPRCESKLLGRE